MRENNLYTFSTIELVRDQIDRVIALKTMELELLTKERDHFQRLLEIDPEMLLEARGVADLLETMEGHGADAALDVLLNTKVKEGSTVNDKINETLRNEDQDERRRLLEVLAAQEGLAINVETLSSISELKAQGLPSRLAAMRKRYPFMHTKEYGGIIHYFLELPGVTPDAIDTGTAAENYVRWTDERQNEEIAKLSEAQAAMAGEPVMVH